MRRRRCGTYSRAGLRWKALGAAGAAICTGLRTIEPPRRWPPSPAQRANQQVALPQSRMFSILSFSTSAPIAPKTASSPTM